MPVLANIGTLYRCLPEGGQDAVHPVPRAAVAWRGERIGWAGPEADLPAEWAGEERLDAGGAIVVPGLVDCHTHLAFGGWRAEEFELKIRGAGYLEIARAGGGIASTVARTRAASSEHLAERCLGHLAAMLELGVTTVEAKSGYGLDFDQELRLLEVYAEVARRVPQRLVATLLAAHTIPPEYRDRRADYVALVIDRIIPEAARRQLAVFCDVFVEDTAFTPAEGRAILEAGKRAGLRPKLHADQITDTGGAGLAAEVGAASADHLERASVAGIGAMAASGVVAVSLPLASLYLNQPVMPARRFIEAGVPVAVATDFNPGSAPSYHLPLAMMLASTLQRMTPAEVLKGVTIHAARALGLEGAVGSVAPGRRADLVVVDAESVEHWLYHFRANAALMTIAAGQVVSKRH
ncbi:MAG: imidazolonepropionase [Gemmatimonadales bacterium]